MYHMMLLYFYIVLKIYIIFLLQDLPAFAEQLVNQISVNLERIHNIGVSKIAVGFVAPLGCLPLVSVGSSYQNCSDEANLLANYHNNLLSQKVQDMNNNQTSGSGLPVYITLDLYSAFLNTITTLQKQRAGMFSNFPLSFSHASF